MATLPRPARPVSLPIPAASDRWRADHERFKLARKRATIRTSMRTVIASVAGFGLASVMLALMAIRLCDMHGITWIASNPMDLMCAVSIIGVPVVFMALAMFLAWEACERMATLIENP